MLPLIQLVYEEARGQPVSHCSDECVVLEPLCDAESCTYPDPRYGPVTVPLRGLGALEGGWTNPCGGTRWQTLPDGLIEVEGRGFPAYSPGSLQASQMMRTWENWGDIFAQSAAAQGVPASWLLAIATMETGLWSDDAAEQEGKESPAGAIGIMQIMPATAAGFDASASAMYDARRNIDVGSRLIRYLAERSDWQLPAIAAKYNSGRLCDSDPCTHCNEWNLRAASDYPGKVIRWNNTAILEGLPAVRPRSSASMLVGVGIAAAGVVLARRLLRG